MSFLQNTVVFQAKSVALCKLFLSLFEIQYSDKMDYKIQRD